MNEYVCFLSLSHFILSSLSSLYPTRLRDPNFINSKKALKRPSFQAFPTMSISFPSNRCLEALSSRVDHNYGTDRQNLPSEPILGRFPPELLLEIFSYLTLPEQVCLSLTTKGMFAVLGDVVNDGRVQLRPGNQDEGPPLTNPEDSSYASLRLCLLLHLVDEQWSYCGYCHILHPREQMFRVGSFRRPVYDRMGLRWAKPTRHCPFSPSLFFDSLDAWRPVMGKFEAVASHITSRRHLRALKIECSEPRPKITAGLSKFYYYKGTALGARIKLRIVVMAYDDGMCVSQSRYKISKGTSGSSYRKLILCPHYNLSRVSHPCVMHCMRCRLSVEMELAPDGTKVVYASQVGC